MPFLSIAQQIALGRKHGFTDDELPDWCAVIMTESGGWTDRVQGRPPGDLRPLPNRHGRGLVQIDLGQHPHVTQAQAFDPDFAAAFARRLSRNRSGLGPTNWYGPRDHPEQAAQARQAARAILAEEAPMQGWMPGAIHTPPHNRSGLKWAPGTAWKLVLHTTESSYRRSSGGRTNYHGHQSYPHAEISEEAIEQYLPLTVGAYALAGSSERWGIGNAAHAIQVELVWQAGNAAEASEDIQRNLARWLTFVRQQTGMEPHVAPQGLPRRVSQDNWFDRDEWYEFEGICGHGNVPGNFDRWDPGPWPVDRVIDLSNAEMGGPAPQPEEPEVAKIAYPVTVEQGSVTRVPVPAIGGGMGWTYVSVNYAAASPVQVVAAKVGPYNAREVPGLHGQRYSGRGYVELAEGDEWVEIALGRTEAPGTLELLVEARDG